MLCNCTDMVLLLVLENYLNHNSHLKCTGYEEQGSRLRGRWAICKGRLSFVRLLRKSERGASALLFGNDDG